MFQFVVVARGLRAAKAALLAKNYRDVIVQVAAIMDAVGLSAAGDKVRQTLAGVTEANARDIAVGALGLLAELLNGVFGFGQPITVSGTPDGHHAPDGHADAAEHAELAGKLESLAACCDQADAGHTTTAALAAPEGGTQPEAIPPALLDALIQLGMTLITNFFARRRANR